MYSFIYSSHLCCESNFWNIFKQKSSTFNYDIFKMLLKSIWAVTATGINYLWFLFFFSCSSVVHAVLAIILARVWCFEYATDDECIISRGMLCIKAVYERAELYAAVALAPSNTQVLSHLFLSRIQDVNLAEWGSLMTVVAPSRAVSCIHIQIQSLISFVATF